MTRNHRRDLPAHNTNDTYERILHVAEDVFSRYGYLGARIDDIAELVGIRRPSLFHHFRNKEALYQAVLKRWAATQADFFEQALGHVETKDPVRELELLVDATFQFLVDHPNYAYLSLHTIASNRIEQAPRDINPTTLNYWADLLERGRASGHFGDATVAECLALVGGMVIFYIGMGDSYSDILGAIGELDRERMRQELQRVVKALVLAG